MALRILRTQWEQQEDLIKLAEETLKQEQQKARLHSSLADLYPKCEIIHASFLFQPSWKTVFTLLCNNICSVPASSPVGWMDFAAYMGLDKHCIYAVEHKNEIIHKNKVYFVLEEFSKDDAATVDKIFRSLDKMKHYALFDILCPMVIELCNSATTHQNYSQDGGYSSEENNSRTIIKPVECKEGVACNSLNTVLTSRAHSHLYEINNECLQKSEESWFNHQTEQVDNGPMEAYSKRVLITFAEDGEATAKDLAYALRNSFDKHQRSVGVVILAENKLKIADDPCIKIAECFNQVDFVIPIITKKYVDRVFPSTIENPDALTPSPAVQPDVYYAPLIFRLMSTEYTRQHCLNTRFRSVIPSDQKELLFSNNPVMSIPFVSPWCLSNDAIKSPRKALLLRRKRCVNLTHPDAEGGNKGN